MSEIVMPRLSDTMEEGTILRWLKRDGEHVSRGEELVEIETDKAAMVYESDQRGTLTLIAAEGDTLAVGEPIARIGDAEASAPAASDGPVQSGEKADDESGVRETTESGSERAEAVHEQAVTGDPTDVERVKASPLARRIAREGNVDLHDIQGSGPGGRIVKADVLAGTGHDASGLKRTEQGDADRDRGTEDKATQSQATQEVPVPAGAPEVATAKGATTEVELTRTQQTVARRMAESKATIPDFTLQVDVDMEQGVALREQLKGLAHGESEEPVPTYNDMVVKASALALREFPQANGSYRDGRIQLHSRINVGVAVAAEGSLVVPTVFDAQEKSLGEIARETRALATRVRDGSITPPELGGGTFTVSNLGMFGIVSFTAIVNPPQAAILSVGALEPRAVARDGEIVARHMMSLTLVCDHRILYGAEAARFLARVRELLESPAALTL